MNQLPPVHLPTGLVVRYATRDDLGDAAALMVRTFNEDFGYGLRPEMHADVVDLAAAYLDKPHSALFVAVDATGALVGTAAIASWDRRHPTHPAWLAERYATVRSAELLRVYVALEHRRRGAARELIELARRWVSAERHFKLLILHTNAGVPGALAFWNATATLVHDSRPNEHNTVHFELALERPVPGSSGDATTREVRA